MVEEAPLDGAEARRYERRFRDSRAFASLLAEAAVDVAPEELERVSVTRRTGADSAELVDIRLRREGTGPEPCPAFIYDGFEAEVDTTVELRATYRDGELSEAELTTGDEGGVLVGRSRVWTYRGGIVADGSWLS
ncbi:hypothetical protein [Haloarchaeobius sp. HME9146]|uniref:hypothetical protein n=1 Tax=Haloarchaeobius sp. HME9146 TaxID=2978732 RepID=UPI0021BFEDF0|nr:hypothetical protein [Haloarchaeobius sp. HME9146]MCT9097180.1 hypothetical protein [Haloarchaeobius sp. HME9146]